MELHTGNCAFCKNSLVIHCRQLQEIWQSIFHIFKKYTSNENELKRIRSELEVCPSCVDMLSMIERNLKEIERYTKNKQFSSKCCLLCGKATTLYKIKEEYKDIAFILNKYKGVSKIKSFMLCSGCFHLTNNSKLMFGQFSRIYPALLNSSINSNSLKTNSPQIRTTSKSKTKFTKKLRPIKSSSYKLNNVVKSDKKLYNEIPYVKVERLVNKPEFSEKIKRLNKPSFKIKLKKHSTIRNAIKRKSTKTSDLLNLGRVLRVDIVRGTLTDSLTAPVKTKGAVKLLNDYSPRKSVTFAEKNIEIEDNFYLNSNNDSIDEKNTVSKSILKNKSPIIKKNIDQDSNLKKKRRLTTFITISSDESDDGLRNWEGGVNVKKSKTKETKSDVNVNGTTENSNTKINLIENRLIVAGKSPRNEISKTKTSEKKRKPRPKSKQREKIKKSDGDEKEQTPQKKRKTQQKSVLADSDNKEKSPSPSNESNDWNSFTSLTSEQMFDQLFKTDNTNKKKYKPKPKSKQTESRLKDKEEQNEGATTVSEKQNGISSDTVVTEPIKPTENDIPKEDNAEFSDVTEDEINLCESFNLDSDENNCADAQNVQNTNDNANIDQSCKDNQNNNAENTKESNEETDSNSIKNNEKTSDSKSNDPISECLPEEELTKNLDNDLIVEKPDDLTESLNNKVTESAIEPSTSKNDDTLLENSISDQDKSTSSSKNTPKKKHKPRPLSKKKKIETNSKGETANASHDNDNSFKETTISDQKETESVNKELTLSQINNTLNLPDEDNAESPKPSGTVNDDVDDDIDKIANKYLSINRPSILDSDKKNISEKFDIDDLIIKDATTELYDDL